MEDLPADRPMTAAIRRRERALERIRHVLAHFKAGGADGRADAGDKIRRLAAKTFPQPGDERRADAARLRRLVDTLPVRERALLQLRYGLGGERPATQQQTADKLGISRSYVSRLEKRALTRLMNAWRR